MISPQSNKDPSIYSHFHATIDWKKIKQNPLKIHFWISHPKNPTTEKAAMLFGCNLIFEWFLWSSNWQKCCDIFKEAWFELLFVKFLAKYCSETFLYLCTGACTASFLGASKSKRGQKLKCLLTDMKNTHASPKKSSGLSFGQRIADKFTQYLCQARDLGSFQPQFFVHQLSTHLCRTIWILMLYQLNLQTIHVK